MRTLEWVLQVLAIAVASWLLYGFLTYVIFSDPPSPGSGYDCEYIAPADGQCN